MLGYMSTSITARCDALGIVVADLARSLDLRALGLDIPEGAEKEPHVEVHVAGGFSLMFDPVSTITSFDPDWTPPTGGPGVLAGVRVRDARCRGRRLRAR